MMFRIFVLLLAANAAVAATLSDGAKKLSVALDASTGGYIVSAGGPEWIFGGTLPPCKIVASGSGADSLGAYQELTFTWRDNASPMAGSIRLYKAKAAILFSETSLDAAARPPPPFPDFTRVPANIHVFSYRQETFAPPFTASDCSTPWLLFDDQDRAAVISPASHFMVASMIGDGRTRIASGFNADLAGLPANFSQRTLMVFGGGINASWDLWGSDLNALRKAKRPSNDADRVLKYFGYWTDNGATYYYNYDQDKGYAGTLRALVEHYRAEGIPLGYLQLDSWWYRKSFTGPDGKIGTTKQPKLPPGDWNRYGGLIEYRPDPALFPNGLESFQKEVSIPFVTHNRWIDPASPYRKSYKISGIGAVDGRWWDDIATYLKRCGIVTYEQDWLDRIYRYSPEFASNPDTGATFVREMARACAERNITMQYCMAYPCFFLEGSQYPNLTTIRVSDDRFSPARWSQFLYTSRLASALGIWPWSDVLMSNEMGNLILATLSAGPVGIGDAIGSEDKANLEKVMRQDGVIVKPDVPCVPLDQCYLRDAAGGGGPLVAATYTDHDGFRTAYLFAYNQNDLASGDASVSPSELGLRGDVYVYEPATGLAKRINAGDPISISLAPRAWRYFAVAPAGPGSVAFLGDSGKLVGTGKQRVSRLTETKEGIEATVLVCPGETVELHGFAPKAPVATVIHGVGQMVGPIRFDAGSGHYTIAVQCPEGSGAASGVQQIDLEIKPAP